jgi:hypothetical protein
MRKPPSNKLLTPEVEQEILNLYADGLSGSKILPLLSVRFKTTKTVYDVLKKHGVLRRAGDTCHDPTLIHTYFHDIDTEDKAYALGLMISDGWVAKPLRDSSGNRLRSPQVGFSLTEADGYMVEWMRSQWASGNKINVIEKGGQTHTNGRVYDHKPMHRIMVTSDAMYEDLDRLGIDANKSYLSILPEIHPEMYPHLIRGMFDGDGSVWLTYAWGDPRPTIQFLGTQCLMGQLAWWLRENTGIEYVKPRSRGRNVILSNLEFSRTAETEKLFHLMYPNDRVTALSRKRKILEGFFGYESGS